jgi:hypothetical protein
VSLRHFQNRNTLIIHHFLKYGVEDESSRTGECAIGRRSGQLRSDSGPTCVARSIDARLHCVGPRLPATRTEEGEPVSQVEQFVETVLNVVNGHPSSLQVLNHLKE